MSKEREIHIPKTILKSSWSYFVVLFLFVNAILYAAGIIQSTESIGEICFYGLMMLILAHECSRWLKDFTFYSYKVENTSEDKE